MEFNFKGKVYNLSVKQRLPISLEEAWSFFSSPKNLATITPEKLNFEILSGADRSVHSGQVIQYSVSPLPFYKTTWVTEITHVKEFAFFVDEQRFGPYSFWHHKHFFRKVDDGVEMEDVVDFKVPFGWLGRVLTRWFIQKQLSNIFDFRKKKLEELFPSNTITS